MLSDVSASSPSWLSNLRRRFIVFDGPDGCGKTTQLRRFARFAEDKGKLTICQLREPGGTEIGEEIRQILLRQDHREDVDHVCEMLLFMASRSQLVSQYIKPALESGQLVLCDRFISSTLAYQGTAGGLPTRDILAVAEVALQNCWPDLFVILDVDETIAAKRLASRSRHDRFVDIEQPTLFSDRMELKGREYHKKVRHGYLDQADRDPQRYLVIDAAPDDQKVFDSVLAALKGRFDR